MTWPRRTLCRVLSVGLLGLVGLGFSGAVMRVDDGGSGSFWISPVLADPGGGHGKSGGDHGPSGNNGNGGSRGRGHGGENHGGNSSQGNGAGHGGSSDHGNGSDSPGNSGGGNSGSSGSGNSGNSGHGNGGDNAGNSGRGQGTGSGGQANGRSGGKGNSDRGRVDQGTDAAASTASSPANEESASTAQPSPSAVAAPPPTPTVATPQMTPPVVDPSEAGRRDEVPDEVVVLNEDAAFLEVADRLGFRVIARYPLTGLGITVTRLRVPGALTPTAAQDLLRARHPQVLIASNGLYRAQGSLSLPPTDYAERLIGWGEPPADCGRGITIGLIDAGLAADHPVFADRAIEARSFLAPAEQPAPLGHGTAVAGILVGAGGAGLPPGLLPGATLRLAETFAVDEAGEPVASVVGVVAALDWLVETRTPVINLSLAGPDNLLLATAVRLAVARGAVLVGAAGNDGAAGSAAYPAAYAEVVAVAAVDRNLAPYGAGTQGDYIDVAAPGVDIAVPAPSGGLSLVSGSSYAAPYVAAAVALHIAKGVPADSDAVHQFLAENARDLGDPGHDATYGWGLLQTAAACRDLIAQP